MLKRKRKKTQTTQNAGRNVVYERYERSEYEIVRTDDQGMSPLQRQYSKGVWPREYTSPTKEWA